MRNTRAHPEVGLAAEIGQLRSAGFAASRGDGCSAASGSSSSGVLDDGTQLVDIYDIGEEQAAEQRRLADLSAVALRLDQLEAKLDGLARQLAAAAAAEPPAGAERESAGSCTFRSWNSRCRTS
jgi:hypothetical protein